MNRADTIPPSLAIPSRGETWRAVIELTKPGIVKMVVLTTGVGFVLSALNRHATLAASWAPLIACIVGATLAAAGANALNQVAEVARDARMSRTQHRPIPSGRLSAQFGLLVGLALSVAGCAVLWFGANPAASVVAVATTLSYMLLYTPLKPLTPVATIVGAIPGALPPLLGWCAAHDDSWASLLEPGGWSLFFLMFVWQIPHVLAISWRHRDDYARAGYRVLANVDPDGTRTARFALLWTITLIPVSLAPAFAMRDLLGWITIVCAVVAGGIFLWAAIGMYRTRSDASARTLFFASIAHLPIVFLGLFADAVLHAVMRQ